jgi:hypothetical protein
MHGAKIKGAGVVYEFKTWRQNPICYNLEARYRIFSRI